MSYLDSVKNELPCPNRVCIGKIKFTISSYHIARGRGEFVIVIDEKEVFCNRCGRIFEVRKDTDYDYQYIARFIPTGKVKLKKELYKSRFK